MICILNLIIFRSKIYIYYIFIDLEMFVYKNWKENVLIWIKVELFYLFSFF